MRTEILMITFYTIYIDTYGKCFSIWMQLVSNPIYQYILICFSCISFIQYLCMYMLKMEGSMPKRLFGFDWYLKWSSRWTQSTFSAVLAKSQRLRLQKGKQKRRETEEQHTTVRKGHKTDPTSTAVQNKQFTSKHLFQCTRVIKYGGKHHIRNLEMFHHLVWLGVF